MIGILICLIIFNAIIYSTLQNSEDIEKDKKYAFRNYFFVSTMMYIFVIFYLKVHTPFLINKFIIISALVLIFITYFRYISKKSKENGKVIKAKNMSYWGIDVEEILGKYSYRIVKKKGRNEVEVDEEEYFFKLNKEDGSKELQPLILSDISSTPDLKLIKNVDWIRHSKKKLYHKLLNKLDEIKEEAELDIDYDVKLKENKHILEFFFIDLWETIAYDVNISATTLSVLAEDDNDIKLIGALDSAKNINVQKDGIVLFSHYLNFKGRIK